MGPRKRIKLNNRNYEYFNKYLNEEWIIIESDFENVDTPHIIVQDILWESFSHFMERNGYPERFCSKILFGRLLTSFGIQKIKRGRRKQQKFFYYPLKARKNSHSEFLISCAPNATRSVYKKLKRAEKDNDFFIKLENGIEIKVCSGLFNNGNSINWELPSTSSEHEEASADFINNSEEEYIVDMPNRFIFYDSTNTVDPIDYHDCDENVFTIIENTENSNSWVPSFKCEAYNIDNA